MCNIKTEIELDQLTELANRHSILNIFQELICNNETSLSILLLDIDNFKKLNDTHGLPVGDQVIKIFADFFKNFVKEKGYIGRYGGEEFLLLLPMTEKEEALLLIEEQRKLFQKEYVIDTEQKKITLEFSFSGGIATFPDDGTDEREILRKADDALYRAKVTGRNKICIAREEKMITKTSYYTQGQLKRLSEQAKKQGVGEAVLLREALDDLLVKYL